MSPKSQVNVGTSARLYSQDDVSQKLGTSPLSLPHLNLLFETFFVRDENSVSIADVVVIPSHHKVTQQILNHWKSFLDLKLTFMVSCHAEQLRLRSQQHIVSTIEDSVLRTEMTDLKSQEEDADELAGTDQDSP